MTKNMGTIDRSVRSTIAVVVLVLYALGWISGTVAIVLSVFAIVFLLTSLVSWCPAYNLIGLSTRPAGRS